MSILVAVVSGFAGGVFVRSLFFESWWPIIFTLLIAGLCGGFAFLRPRRVYSLVAVFFVFVAFGMMRAELAEEPLPASFASEVKRRVSYEGVVVADPDVRDTNQRTQIRVSSAGESTTMLAVAPRYPTVAVGDTVFVSGTVAVPEPFADDNGRIFRYDKYLERDGVRFILNFAYLRVESPAPWYSISATFARVKHAFIDGIRAALPEPHASLAGGIVIGGKSGLGNELKEDFIRSGLVHIIVLSGYNVMVVASGSLPPSRSRNSRGGGVRSRGHSLFLSSLASRERQRPQFAPPSWPSSLCMRGRPDAPMRQVVRFSWSYSLCFFGIRSISSLTRASASRWRQRPDSSGSHQLSKCFFL